MSIYIERGGSTSANPTSVFAVDEDTDYAFAVTRNDNGWHFNSPSRISRPEDLQVIIRALEEVRDTMVRQQGNNDSNYH